MDEVVRPAFFYWDRPLPSAASMYLVYQKAFMTSLLAAQLRNIAGVIGHAFFMSLERVFAVLIGDGGIVPLFGVG